MNKVELTDDELSLIATSLQTTITSMENYIKVNGEKQLDKDTLTGLEEMKSLFDKINSNYF